MLKIFARKLSGVFLIGLGTVGTVIPFMPGVIFLIIGLALLLGKIPFRDKIEGVMKKVFPEETFKKIHIFFNYIEQHQKTK